MRLLMAALVAALGWLALVQAQEYVTVQTEYGAVRGTTINVDLFHTQTTVTNFYGVPFGRAPVGELRFMPPQKPEPWEGTLNLDGGRLRLPAQCMQNPTGLLYITHPLFSNYNEDCLNMIIYTPSVSGPPKSVMVWFYGGGYVSGGNIQYPGHFLAARDVVVAAVNYRIGVFGFAATPDGTIHGNMGLRDQVLALEFIRDNIAAFGGNPNRVTIFGQSAGASSASLLVLSPHARGLFHQAILESGSENNIWSLNYPDQSPEHYLYQVAQNTSCLRDNDPDMVACLQALPSRDLRLADHIECTVGTFCQGFAPIVDGPGGFIPEKPLDMRRKLGDQSVPMITGICSDDGSLYTIFFIPEALDGGFTRAEFQYYLRDRLTSIWEAQAATDEIYENTYQAYDWYYTPWPYIEDLEENRQAINKMITDGAFGYAWDRQSKINAQHANTYAYVEKFRSSNENDTVPEWMGNPHSGELAYVFGYSYLHLNPEVRQQSGMNLNIVTGTEDDIPYSNYIQTLWTNFAKFGDPTPTPVKSPFNDTMTTWPRFSHDDNHKILFMDSEISVVENYRQQQYAFFIEYISYVSKLDILKGTQPKVSTSTRGKYQMKTADQQELMTNFVLDHISRKAPELYEEVLRVIEDEQ
jgi:carboxylesterase type B